MLSKWVLSKIQKNGPARIHTKWSNQSISKASATKAPYQNYPGPACLFYFFRWFLIPSFILFLFFIHFVMLRVSYFFNALQECKWLINVCFPKKSCEIQVFCIIIRFSMQMSANGPGIGPMGIQITVFLVTWEYFNFIVPSICTL